MQHPGFVIEPFLYIPTGKKILSKDENDVRNHELPLLLLQRLLVLPDACPGGDN